MRAFPFPFKHARTPEQPWASTFRCGVLETPRRALISSRVWVEKASLLQGGDGDVDDGYSEGVRHAETPELAREALADCAILIFKGQVEVAFRCAGDSSCTCCFSTATFPMLCQS